MDISELITIHVCTLIVIAVSLILGRELWKRYRSNLLTSSLLIFLYVLSILITYVATFLYRFPTPEKNAVEHIGLIIPILGVGGYGFIPYLGALFSIYLLEPRRENLWIVSVSLFEAAYVISLMLYPPACIEVRPAIFEWIAVGAAARTIYLTVIIAAVPVLLFIAYSIKSVERRSRAKGIMLSVALAMLAFLVTVCDGIGGYVPIGIRRVFIAVAVILLYLGFVMPSWLSEILNA